jgi:hypothetical protein
MSTTMSIDQALDDLGAGLRARISEIAHRIHERTLDAVPEYYDNLDPALLELDYQISKVSLRDIFDGLSHGRNPPAHASGTVLEEARLAAQAGVNLQVLIRTHRVAQATTWEAILEETERVVDDPALRLSVLTLASRYHFDWNDRVTSEIVRAYEQERELLFRDRERRKRELVRDILNGMPADAGRVPYHLRGEHLAVIAWGAAPHEAVHSLADPPRCNALTVPGTGDAVFGWLEGPPDRLADLAAAPISLPEGSYLALGAPARGIEGFRFSHRQALQAYRVARIHPRGVTSYREVALEALVIREPQLARDFMAYELSGIAGSDHRDRVLRETLRAYFRTGQNASSAAHLLGVHERTVAYRLRSVEDRIGVPVGSRRDELSVALRVFELLDASSRAFEDEYDVGEAAKGAVMGHL